MRSGQRCLDDPSRVPWRRDLNMRIAFGMRPFLNRRGVGAPPGFNECDVDSAFRLPGVQADNARSCDGLKYGCVNPRYGGRTPISLPTLGHIGEMCLIISDTDRDWPYFKTDHESTYNNLPLTPESGKLRLITLRNPPGGFWYGFWSRTLLSGDPEAFLHYNAFSWIVSFLANKIFGLPVVNYFGDLGCLLPASVAKMGLRTFHRFSATVRLVLNDIKKKVARAVAYPGLEGSFPDPRAACLSPST